MALYNANLKPLDAGNSTHDYNHAKRLFLADNLRLSPKQSFLYYVCININQDFLTSIFGTGISSQGVSDQYETGMMVKSVELPKFSMDTKTMNAYNKKTIVQNKINYDPVSLTFHDDAANVVLNFWNDYYTYYFRDSDYESALYRAPSTYDLRQRTKWGYSPRNSGLIPFLRDIQIFSLNQKRFTEYKLINPMITNWRHGEHRATEGSGVMECAMTLAYETVKYRTGYVNPTDVNGFSLLHYDTTPSPISTSTTNVYTDQGVIGVIGGAATDLSRPDGAYSGTNLISNYLSVQRAYNNLKSVNWGTVAQKTLAQIGINIVGGSINGAANGLLIPYSGSYGSGTSGIAAQNLVSLSGISSAFAPSNVTGAATNSIYGVANSTTASTMTSINAGVSQTVGGITGLVTQIATLPITMVNSLLTQASNSTFNFISDKIINPMTNQIDTWLYQASSGISDWYNSINVSSQIQPYEITGIKLSEELMPAYTATSADNITVPINIDTTLTETRPYGGEEI